MGQSTAVEDEPAQEEILRRPEEHATDPGPETIDSPTEPIEPPPEREVPPLSRTTGGKPTSMVPDPERLHSADDRTGRATPVLDDREGSRQFPMPVLAAGVAILVVVGLGLILLFRGGDEDVVVAGADSFEEEESVEGDPAPPSDSPETRDFLDEHEARNGDEGGGGNDVRRDDEGDDSEDGDDRDDRGNDNDNNGNDNGNNNGDPDPPRVEIPDVVGHTIEDAEAALTAQDLVVDTVRIETEDIEPGRVVAQDPGEGQRVERQSTVQLGVADRPPPDVNLTVELDSCSLVLGGAPSGADALVFSLHTLNLGAEEVTTNVLTRVTADGGLTIDAIGRLSGRDSSINPTLELGPDDYRGPLNATITIDPDDEIPESTRDNNTLNVRVELPDALPEADLIPVPCG